jgi:hypothetical protein
MKIAAPGTEFFILKNFFLQGAQMHADFHAFSPEIYRGDV